VRPSFETLRELIRACGLDLTFTLREADSSQDATIAAALRLTPVQRLEQLEAWADFILEARRNLASV
jgi:hypothetical protein